MPCSVSLKSLAQYARVTLNQEVIRDERCKTCAVILPKDRHEPLGLFTDVADGTLFVVCSCIISIVCANDRPKEAKRRNGPLRPRKGKK